MIGEAPPKRIRPLTITSGKFGFRGIEWRAERQKFRARLKRRYLGMFDTAVEAAQAYDAAAVDAYGEDAWLNFPGSNHPNKVRLSRRAMGICPEGHALYGKRNCLICNAQAVSRYKARKKAQS